MSISKYNEKRDFEKTKEPKSGKKPTSKKLRFVVQRHHASHLHYDFRLEMDGVLKSWAVPKGPSLNPKDKRLAMMVEDHPYDYKDFEGEIPKGNYGAGTVSIFDEGFYQSLSKLRKDDESTLEEGLKSGSLKFTLKGKILKGEFALVKLKNAEQNAWLLIKHNDEYAISEKFNIENLVSKTIIKAGKDFKKKEKTVPVKELPKEEEDVKDKTEYSPMLATLASQIFDDEQWVFERKFDGYRILAYTGKDVILRTRNGKDYSDNYQMITQNLSVIKDEAIIDGEIVAHNKQGKDDFQTLQHYENETSIKLAFYAFDLLFLNGNDLTELPLLQRKKLLKALLDKYEPDNVIYNEHVEKTGKTLFKKAEKEGWEGLIGKRKNDGYTIGKRTDSWLKFKFNNSQEALICGFTKPSGSRKYFGALVLGVWDADKKLKYIGNCGTGFKDDDLQELHQKMESLIVKTKPFKDKVNQEKAVTWIKPNLVCEVNYTEWTQDEHLRHPVFKGLRVDKNNESVIEEIPAETMEDTKQEKEKVKIFGKKKVKITHVDKIYWPKEKITKGELVDYYEEMADAILPYLKDKPLSLNRHPNGITKPGFFQKDIQTDQVPDWIKTAEIHSESNDKEIDYLICNDTATMLYMANLGCIEINPWLSTYKKPEHPEFLVMDIDPDKHDFKDVVSVALTFKEVFDELNIKCYVKTSGSSGIHVYVYIGAKYDYDFVKSFAEFIAHKVFERTSDFTSVERSLNKRKGLIYLDFLQNRRGQTIACPYSVRPKPGATVSFPLNWDELTSDLDMKNFHIKNVPDLMKKRKDPWADILKEKQDLKKALGSLKSKKETK